MKIHPEFAVTSENHATRGADISCMCARPEFFNTHTDITTFTLAQCFQVQEGKQ